MAKIILEDTLWIDNTDLQLVESIDESTGESVTVIKCPFQAVDIRNANQRLYPRAIFQAICAEGSYIQEKIKATAFHGMLGHPKDGVGDDGEVTHTVTCLKIGENGVVHGELRVNNTPRGKIIQEYRKERYQFGISSRGLGSVSPDGIVQEDYELRAFDVVLNPSTPGATVKPASKVNSANENKKEPKPVSKSEPVTAAVSEIVESQNVAPAGSGKTQEVNPIMSMFKDYKLLENEAKPLLDLKESDVASKREVGKAQTDILDLTSKLAVLDESVKVQRDGLVQRLMNKREKMDEWGIGGHLATSDSAADASDTKKVDEAEALKKELEEAKTKLAEETNAKTAAVELAEAIKRRNEEIQSELKEAVEDRDAAETFLEASIELIGAISAVFEGTEMVDALESAIAANPKLAEFRTILRRAETQEELSETVKSLSAALGAAPLVEKKTAGNSHLPPKGESRKTPNNIGEKLVEGKTESGAEEGTEESAHTLVTEGASLWGKIAAGRKKTQLQESKED